MSSGVLAASPPQLFGAALGAALVLSSGRIASRESGRRAAPLDATTMED